MTSQLERLAKPIPDRYVKPPAPGMFGHYCDHEIITQILLAICGPFSFEVQQVLYSPDGLVEGCTASLTVEVDGRSVTITEAGKCDHADKQKSQGDRLKKSASDALKRCAMRLSLGLKIWSGEQDYFLYDQLRENAEGSSQDPASLARAAPSAGSVRGRSYTGTTAPAPEAEQPHPHEEPSPGPISKNQLGNLQSRVRALNAEKMGVADRRIARGLPPLTDKCSPSDLDNWADFITDLEAIRKVKA